MEKFEFRANGLTQEQSRQWKKLSRPSRLSAGAITWTVAAIAVIYSTNPLSFYFFNRPSQISVTSSVDDDFTTVAGSVDDPRIKEVTLDVGGVPLAVPVENGTFTLQLPQLPEETTVSVSAGSVSSPPIKPSSPTTGPRGTAFGSLEKLPLTLEGNIYFIDPGTRALPDFARLKPVGKIYARRLNVTRRYFTEGFPGVASRFEWFAIDYKGTFTTENPGNYRFRLTSDDGAKLFLDDRLVIDNDGIHPSSSKEALVMLRQGTHHLRVEYFQGPGPGIELVLEAAPEGEPYAPLSPGNHPGRIEIATPSPTVTSDGEVKVTGTVENKQIKAITLKVNKFSKIVNVTNGEFESTVPRSRGENIIWASAGDVASNVINIIPKTNDSGPSGGTSTGASAECKRINCDCDNVEFGLLTREYRNECRKTEAELIRLCKETGKVDGKCHATASGPNAWPR